VRQLLAERPAAEATGGVDFAGALAAWLGKASPAPGALYHGALAAFEKPLFEHALRETGGNQLRAAQLLGINRNTLRKRLDDLRIDPERFSHRG
jgi:two-component system nitrogen regulation response regulator GlnG